MIGSSPADRRIALRLAACAAIFYAVFHQGLFMGSDEVGVFESTRALYEHGDLAVPDIPHAFAGRDGRRYSVFAVGQAVLALPFYAAGKLATAVLPESWTALLAGRQGAPGALRFGGSAEIFAVGLYAPAASGLLIGVFYALQRRFGASRRSALLASALLGFTTYTAAMSIFFLRHTTEALLLLLAIAALHAWKESGRLAPLALGSLFGSLTLLVRVPAAIAAPAFTGYVAWHLRRRASTGPVAWGATLAALGLPAAAVLAVHVGVNEWRWGTAFASPMLDQASALITPLAHGAAGLLVSPGASIFVYSPLLLLVPWTGRAFARSHPSESALITGIFLSFLVLSAKFAHWHGLWSAPGPRLLFVATPLLMLPLGPWLDRARGAGARAAVVGLALAGAAVQGLLVTVSWARVVAVMNLPAHRPLGDFLFDPGTSPLVGYARLFAAGRTEGPWLWWLAQDTATRAGSPGTALGLLALWLLVLAAALAWLARALRAGDDPRESGPPGRGLTSPAVSGPEASP